jgi:hypothetical protein
VSLIYYSFGQTKTKKKKKKKEKKRKISILPKLSLPVSCALRIFTAILQFEN